MSLSFSARCARGHEAVEFTDRAAFEDHMTIDHGAKRLKPGGASLGLRAAVLAPGTRKVKPWRATTTPGGLTRVCERIAAGEYRWAATVNRPSRPAAELVA